MNWRRQHPRRRTSGLGYAGSVNLDAGPSERLSLGTRIAQAGSDPFLNERPLKLRHGADDLEHEAPGRCAEIEVVAEAYKCDSIGAKLREGINQMLQRAAEAIDLPNQHGVEVPPATATKNARGTRRAHLKT